MKVEFKRQEKEFQPIELTIKIQSQQELNALIDMAGFNVSIPDLCKDENQQIIEGFLTEIHDQLIKY